MSVPSEVLSFTPQSNTMWNFWLSSQDQFRNETDENGNIYIMSTTDALINDFKCNGVPLNPKPNDAIPPGKSNESYLIKYNKNGVLQWIDWINVYAGDGNSGTLLWLGIDNNNDVLVSGHSNVNDSSMILNGVPKPSGNDVPFLIKYSGTAITPTRIWAKWGPIESYFGVFDFDESNNIYVSGYASALVDENTVLHPSGVSKGCN